MIFLAYIVVFGTYIIIALTAILYVPTRFKTSRSRWTAFLIAVGLFVALPAGRIYYERSYFDGLCEKEAGVKIYKSVEGVVGVQASVGAARQSLQRYPYKFIEEEDPNAGLVRYSLAPNGELVMEKVTVPASRYVLSSEVTELGFNHITKSEYRITDRTSGELLGVRTMFSRGDNWFKPWLSSGPCSSQSIKADDEFLLNTLKPAITK